MDGQLLAKAREEKENIRRRSLAEASRRQNEAGRRIPALSRIDRRLSALVGEVIDAVSGQHGRSLEEIQQESLFLQEQRRQLITSQGWPADYLDGAWDCPRCRDTGFVEGRMCPCLRTLYDQERARSLSALLKLGSESFETFDLSWYSDVYDPVRKRSPREQMKGVYDFCRDYAGSFGPDSLSLLFRGGTGLGKTFLSACIAREVSEKGFSVVYETTVDALGAFEQQRFHHTEEADERVARLTGCDLLILDDLGTEMVTEFTRSALYTLINARLLGRKKTIISTNLTRQEMDQVYSPQICSRLEGEYQDLPFVGTDIRLQRKVRRAQ